MKTNQKQGNAQQKSDSNINLDGLNRSKSELDLCLTPINNQEKFKLTNKQKSSTANFSKKSFGSHTGTGMFGFFSRKKNNRSKALLNSSNANIQEASNRFELKNDVFNLNRFSNSYINISSNDKLSLNKTKKRHAPPPPAPMTVENSSFKNLSNNQSTILKIIQNEIDIIKNSTETQLIENPKAPETLNLDQSEIEKIKNLTKKKKKAAPLPPTRMITSCEISCDHTISTNISRAKTQILDNNNSSLDDHNNKFSNLQSCILPAESSSPKSNYSNVSTSSPSRSGNSSDSPGVVLPTKKSCKPSDEKKIYLSLSTSSTSPDYPSPSLSDSSLSNHEISNQDIASYPNIKNEAIESKIKNSLVMTLPKINNFNSLNQHDSLTCSSSKNVENSRKFDSKIGKPAFDYLFIFNIIN